MAIAAAYAQVIPARRHRGHLRAERLRPDVDAATRPRSLDHRYNLEIFLGGSVETRAAYHSARGASSSPHAPPTLILHGGLDINVFPEQAELLDANLARPACRTRW